VFGGKEIEDDCDIDKVDFGSVSTVTVDFGGVGGACVGGGGGFAVGVVIGGGVVFGGGGGGGGF
jgi:hypothetical protein